MQNLRKAEIIFQPFRFVLCETWNRSNNVIDGGYSDWKQISIGDHEANLNQTKLVYGNHHIGILAGANFHCDQNDMWEIIYWSHSKFHSKLLSGTVSWHISIPSMALSWKCYFQENAIKFGSKNEILHIFLYHWVTSYGYTYMIVNSCIISFNLNCIMQLKQFYNIATKVSSRKMCYYFWWSTWLINKRVW